MSYYEAKEDNIPIEKHGGSTWYYPPCKICGSPVSSWSYIRGAEYTCKECKQLIVEYKLKEADDENYEKKLKKFNTAVKRIEKVSKIEKYESAIETVKKSLCKHGWFQSTEEIMVAIELIKNGFKVYHQVKVYRYSVDFIIPKLKVALEIDGELFHSNRPKEHEELRDELIADKLGEGWNVIRIKTDLINMNITKLVPAIKTVLRYRKKKNRTQ